MAKTNCHEHVSPLNIHVLEVPPTGVKVERRNLRKNGNLLGWNLFTSSLRWKLNKDMLFGSIKAGVKGAQKHSGAAQPWTSQHFVARVCAVETKQKRFYKKTRLLKNQTKRK